MRLDSVRIRHLGPFVDFKADLRSLGNARIVAVVGPNGTGKSVFLETAIPGALYRDTPTRGSLAKLATARDAMLEVSLVNGRPYTIRHTIDSVSGKGESLVLDAEGQPVPGTESAKVTAFKEWAATHLPAEEVLYSSVFAPQGSGGFISLSAGDMKAALLRILDIERYEGLAEAARDRKRATEKELAVIVARIQDERQRGGDRAEAERALDAAIDAVIHADAEAAKADLALRAAEAAAADVAEAIRTWQRRKAEADTIRYRIAEAEKKLVDLHHRAANNRTVLAEADAIRAAIAEREDWQRKEQDARADVARLTAEVKRLDAEVESHARSAQEQADRIQTETRRRDVLANALGAEAVIRAAVAEIPQIEEDLAAAKEKLAAAEHDLASLSEQRLAGADERITGLRDGLTQIVVHPGDSRTIAVNTLTSDDAAVALAHQMPARVHAATSFVAETRRAVDRLTQALHTRTETAALASALERDRIAHAEAEKAILAARCAQDELSLAHAAGIAAVATHRALVTEAQSRVNECIAAINRVQSLAAKAEPLAKAEARLAELEPQIAETTATIDRDKVVLIQYEDLGEAPSAPDVDAARKRATAAAGRARDAHAVQVTAELALTAARESAGRVEQLAAEQRAIEGDLSDWSRLAADLGRDGLQAIEIGAAGPELTATVNELLHGCHGPRWTVTIETQRASADGKRMIEDCQVRVLDTERGREDEASTYSGGERVIIGEAVSLGLMVMSCRRKGITGATVVRDETGAALDPQNARAYVAMLRRAADLVDADKILIVSHSADVLALIDAEIRVGEAA